MKMMNFGTQKKLTDSLAEIMEIIDGLPDEDRLDKLNKLSHLLPTIKTMVGGIQFVLSDVDKASLFRSEQMDHLIETLLDVQRNLNPYILLIEELVKEAQDEAGFKGQMEQQPFSVA